MSFQQLKSLFFKNSLPDVFYSKRAVSSLPSLANDLDIFNTTDYANVLELDATTTDVVTDGTNTTAVFIFKGRNNLLEATEYGITNITDYSPSIFWQGTSTVDAATANVVLQIFNYLTDAWETITTDSTTVAGTTILLSYDSDLSPNQYQYYNGNQVAFRVYQTSASTTLSTDNVLVWFDSHQVDGSASGTLNVPITASADDGYESGSTSWQPSSGSNYVGNVAGSARDLGLRFQNITIPSGSTITSAFITVYTVAVANPPTKYTIKGIKEANPAVWNGSTRRPSQLAKTTASASGTITSTSFSQTVDCTTVAQELVDQGGWASGNAMSYVILNNANLSSRYSIFYDYIVGNSSFYPALHISYTAGGSTTSQTILGKARIEKSVTQTILGKADILKSTAQTILAKARITVTTSQTIQGLSRITATATQTILGKARITAITTQTILGKADILRSVAQTIQGLARITVSTAQTILGKARITATATQTILGKADILKTTTQTIQGLSRITATTTKTIQGIARVTVTTGQTILGKARITATTAQTILGKADILKAATQTIQGLARITITTTQTIQGVASIIVSATTQTILGKARITATATQTIQGLSRVTATTIQTILGKARITITTSQTIQGLSRITTIVGQTLLGKADILGITLQLILGKARIQITTSRTIQGVANIVDAAITTTQTILGKSRITATTTRTIKGKALIMSTVSKPYPKIIVANGKLYLQLSGIIYTKI